jgi:hypothetical protein
MKKLTLVMLAMLTAGLVLNSSAATFTITQTVTNTNPTMIVPPVDDAPDSWAQLPDRNLLANTNKAITAGQIYRTGRQAIIAANSGNLTTVLATNVVGSVTNVTIAAITVPVSGTVADGTVNWFRLRSATDTHLRLTILSSANGSVTLKNGRGDLMVYGPSQYSIAYTGTSTGTTDTNTLVFASTSAPAYQTVDLDGVTSVIYAYTSGVSQTNVINTASW